MSGNFIDYILKCLKEIFSEAEFYLKAVFHSFANFDVKSIKKYRKYALFGTNLCQSILHSCQCYTNDIPTYMYV